jgi:phosphatidylglycerophosphate synthase
MVFVSHHGAREDELRSFATQQSGQTPPQGGTVVLLRSEYVLAEELVRALVATPGVVLMVESRNPGGQIPVAAHVTAERAEQIAAKLSRGNLGPDDPVAAELRILGAAELGSSYNQPLRKRAEPFVLSLAERPIIEVEKATFSAVYKGATDFVTKWCWPLPARCVTRWAARHHISPNSITTVSLVFVFIAIYFFAEGQYILGVAAAWFMTFLDTVDGKLARVTLTSSKWGNVYDHGIDLIHPPFWWAAWWYGLQAGVEPALAPWLDTCLWVICVGYVVGRLLEGVFHLWFKIQTHIWRPVDSFFRTITARRNPNLALLMVGALVGRPDLGFIAVAVWTILSIAFHIVRIGQAAWVQHRGGEIRSWLNESN